MYAALAAILAWPAAVPAAADEHALQQSITVYDIAREGRRPGAQRQLDERARVVRLQSGNFGNPEDFTAEARVAFKSEKRRIVADARAFEVSPSASLPEGWRGRGGVYVWHGKADEGTLAALPLAPAADRKTFRPGEFQELWIDYAPSPGVALCSPQVELLVAPSGQAQAPELLARTSDPAAVKPLIAVDAIEAAWGPKEFGYLAGRVLGLEPDEDWRYSQDQANGVLQRRLHVPLDQVELLDIVLMPGVRIEQVNLRVGLSDGHRGGEVIQLSGFPQKLILPDGRDGLRIDLRAAVAQRFPGQAAENAAAPGRHRFHLKEVFIFVPGDAAALAATRAVRGLTFLGKERIQGGPPTMGLPSNVQQVSPARWRMAIDLRQLTARGELDLRAGALRLVPPAGAAFCAIAVERMQAVAMYNESLLPVFARRVEEWSRRWGGPFSVVAPKHNAIEDPGIVGYLPFAALTAPEVARDAGLEMLMKLGPNNQIQVQPTPAVARRAAYRIAGPGGTEALPERPRLLGSAGATLAAEGALPRVTFEGDVLVLEGRSTALELTWPLKAALGERTMLFLALPEGAEQVESITLGLDVGGRAPVQQRIVPNQATELATSGRELRGVTLRIVPATIPYRYKLREMVLFAPRPATYAHAFGIALPTPYSIAPKPEFPAAAALPAVEAQPGRVAGLTTALPEGGTLRFSTTLDPPLEWVRGVQLKYRLPPPRGDARPCALALQFQWTNGKTERRLCLDNTDGTVFVPIAEWLKGVTEPQNLGALQAIDWTLQLASGEAPHAEFFDLQFSIDGIAMIAATDHMRLSRIFDPAALRPLAAPRREDELALGLQRIWVSTDPAVSARIVREGRAQPVDHPLFVVDQVVVRPKEPMSDARWRALIQSAPALQAAAGWPKLIALGALLLVAWPAWRWGSGALSRAARGIRTLLGVTLRLFRWAVGGMLGWVWRWEVRRDLLAGALALCGIWMAGRQAMGLAGAMLAIGSVLLAFAAYCHWRERSAQPWPGAELAARAWPIILAGSVACAVWSLGRFGPSTQALWGLLPALATGYRFAPGLYRRSRQHAAQVRALSRRYRSHLQLAVWVVLAALLYGLGLAFPRPDRENYFFTLGAFAAALALHSMLRATEPRWGAWLPSAAERIRAGAGLSYFAAALVALALLVGMLVLKRSFAVEQLGIAVYFLLLVGALLEVLALRGGHVRQRTE